MKKPSKKTLHRQSRIPGLRSHLRKANRLKQLWQKAHEKVYWYLRKFKKKNRLTPKQQGRPAHINEVSMKINLTDANLNIAKELGYKPRVTKRKKETVIRFYDGYNCKERRMVLISLRKLERAA